MKICVQILTPNLNQLLEKITTIVTNDMTSWGDFVKGGKGATLEYQEYEPRFW